MSRQLRIQFQNALYHVTDRGLEKRKIFMGPDDYESFLSYLQKTIKSYHVIIHAFCLMPNHYHLECETPDANLSDAMQWLNTSYSVYFNRIHSRSGHLFQGRFKALLVEKGNHLLELTRYIHLNPVRAHLVDTPEEFEWSSYRDYLSVGSKREWVSSDWTLSQFGKTQKGARNYYRKFVEEGLNKEIEDPTKNAAAELILGEEGFVHAIKEKYLEDRPLDPEQPALRKLIKDVSIGEITKLISDRFEVEEYEILQKGKHGNKERDIAIYLCRRYCGLKNVELAQQFGGMKGANISMIYKKVDKSLQRDRLLRKKVSDIENLIFKV
jgi:REP element-mobilizing transposase RayT